MYAHAANGLVTTAIALLSLKDASGTETATTAKLEEIVVTAEKREKVLQDIPAAIQSSGQRSLSSWVFSAWMGWKTT